MTRLLLLALPLALSACAVPSDEVVYLRPGAPSAEAARTLAACRADSDARFPERRVLSVDPTVGIGVGIGRGGRVRGGLGTSIRLDRPDRNAGARSGAFEACMARAGYQAAVLPVCDGPAQPLTVQPFDLRGLCTPGNGTVVAPV